MLWTTAGGYTAKTGADPAANTEVSDTVPAGQVWALIAVVIDLVQGITQTPQPILQIDDGTTVVAESVGSTAAQGASTTCRYAWGTGYTLTGQIGATPNIRSFAPLPFGLVLPAGYRIRTVTLGIGANTNYGAPRYLVAVLA